MAKMDGDVSGLKPLGLFLVEYQEGDILGHGLAYFSNAPPLVAAFIIGYWLRARDLHSPFMSLGLCVCVAVNMVLKNLIKEPRPFVHTHMKTYGMPSDHSQFMGFMATYVCGLIITRCRPSRSQLSLLAYVTAAMALWTLVFLTCWSRVYLQYHFVDQVIIGCSVGAVLALIWLAFVLNVVEPHFRTISAWPLFNLLLDPATR